MGRLHIGIAAMFGAALLSVSIADAQNGTLGSPGTGNSSQITAGTYSADGSHTIISWRVNHFGFSDYFGLIGNVTGTLKLDPANTDATEVEMTIPVTSITTANPALTAHLLKPGKEGAAPDFFGPTPADAIFKSTQVRSTDHDEAMITGMLTLNGVTKPVSIMASFTGAGANPYSKKQTIGFKGWGRIKRSDFGITYGIPAVTDTVDLEISAAFEKQ